MPRSAGNGSALAARPCASVRCRRLHPAGHLNSNRTIASHGWRPGLVASRGNRAQLPRYTPLTCRASRIGSEGNRPPPEPVKLVVFDWDGTVVDSIEHIVESWTRAFRDWEAERGAVRELEGMRPCGVPAADTLRRCIGLSVAASITLLVPDAAEEDTELITELYRKYFIAGAGNTKFFPEAEDGLASLAGRDDIVLAVATGKSRRGLDRELELLGARQWFASTRTADCSKSKPDPQMLLELLEETGVPPGATLMVGDSLLDLRMAEAAGVRSLAVGFGAEPKEDLLGGGPVCCVADWPSLVAVIEGLIAHGEQP